MCPFVPCEYPIPIEIGSNEAFGDFDLDNIFLPDFYCSQVQVKDHDDHHVKQSESPPSTSSADLGGGVVAATDRKMNHNASERDRRKKINGLYSSLRALLPSTDHMVSILFKKIIRDCLDVRVYNILRVPTISLSQADGCVGFLT